MKNEKYICYLDILGFHSRIKNTDSNFREFYEKLVEDITEGIATYNKVNLYAISDSVVIISDDIEDIVNTSFAIYSDSLKKGIFIRGAVTKGVIDSPPKIHTIGNNVIIPYLGDGYLKAYEMEKDINCAAIYVDNNILDEPIRDIKIDEFLFKYREIFPKEGKGNERFFLITDMANNWSVSRGMLSLIQNEIPNLSEHDIPKFINTFCLYYMAMRDKYDDSNNLETYHKYWINILESLHRIGTLKR